ncbi:YggS family pyridoxal phosphate-dependent enzyme [Chryseobacterium sp. SNU WT5]|uniref:YggS family pyridoxal phosphate-dependent enzyme n=1 Tax=Chryseobacterium sp. SNU WT5 TaxID=2594269 RepID=UPI00117EA9D8|nr:YggS family pyridoxal phosphate-dependent enzyme [Chryseobacterium sp. SNU WT5]QDP84028.1 YggS family pyridoxal phosphate-dependent enzyme [Chryseobacterium sp. SNU WT5]
MSKTSGIVENYLQIKLTIPDNVALIAVSKNHSVDSIERIYNTGHREFGENKVQELVDKYNQLPKDIKWHLIGHLQTNKVKYIAEFVEMIESADSRKILVEIDKQAAKYQRKIKVLLQIKIAEEETKYGLEIHEAKELYQEYLNGEFPNVEVKGLMGMATFTDDEQQLKKEFSLLKHLFDQLSHQNKLETLSMGMSDDYPIAISCGANSVRVGSAIFGKRS